MIYCDGNSGEGLLSAFEFSCGELDTNTTYILMVDGWNGDAGTCFLAYEVTNPCSQPVFGCTDPIATNYNPEATVNDGSCTYDCTEVYLGFDFFGGAPQDSSFMFWTISNDFGEIVEDGFFYNWAPQYDLCLEDGCYSLNIYNISPEWAGIYSIFTAGQNEYFGEFDGSSETFTVEFGINTPGCGQSAIEGCTDPTALNYNPFATIDDGSCEYSECENNEVIVLINTENWGYEISWNIRNDEGEEVAGSGDYPSYSTITELACLEDGCYTFELFDSFGDGWNDGTFELILDGATLASGTLEDGEFGSVPFGVNAEGCEEVVLGCTDPDALNYNPNATEDDDSCEYFECANNEVMVMVFTENWGYEISWNIRNEEGEEVAGSGDYPNFSTITEWTCLEDGCYTFELFDSFGDGWNGGSFQVILNDTILASGTLETGEFGSVAFGVNAEGCQEEEIFGCLDPLAVNFNPFATIDDGTCQYPCTDVSIGFDFSAGVPPGDDFMNWMVIDQSTQMPIDTGVFNDWADFIGLCIEDGCYTLVIGNIPSEWEGIYNILVGNEFVSFGDFDGNTESIEVHFGVNTDGCGDTEQVFGCTDPEALNYNPNATIDDGSCSYDFECGISFDVIADSTGENTFYIIPSDNIVNASSVFWDFGDGGTSNEYYPTHIYEDDGPYVLCLFVTFGDSLGNMCEISYCEVLDGSVLGGSGVLSGGFNINVVQPGTLSDNVDFAETEIAVYPNPTNNITTISYLSDRSEKLTLRVTDLTGKILEQRILSSSIGQQKISVDLSEFPQGLYLIGLEQDGSSSYAKVVRR